VLPFNYENKFVFPVSQIAIDISATERPFFFLFLTGAAERQFGFNYPKASTALTRRRRWMLPDERACLHNDQLPVLS
jgi:hypothetical protein